MISKTFKIKNDFKKFTNEVLDVYDTLRARLVSLEDITESDLFILGFQIN